MAGGTSTGSDTFKLIGDSVQAAAAPATAYALVPNISDFSISGSGGTDVVSLSATKTLYAGASALTDLFAGIAVAAAGSTVISTLAKDAGAAALNGSTITTTDLIKLTTAATVAGAVDTVQEMFDSAIGTSTMTNVGTGKEMFVSYFDATNLKMVLLIVDTVTATSGTLDTGDVVTLIGTIDMTAANYALFGTANFAIG